MHSQTINRIIHAHTLSGSDFNAKRVHWTLKAVATFTVVSLAVLIARGIA